LIPATIKVEKRRLFFARTLFTLLFIFLAAALFAQPRASFSADTSRGCAPLVVHFTDQSTGTPTSWRWDLGNGNTSFTQNPAATYFSPGTYTVKLVVTNALGADSVVKTNYVTAYASPTIDFSASQTTGCFPLTVQFTDLSDPGGGNASSWLWDFGDGTLDSVKNPSHTYINIGNYNVSLRIKNANGCENTLTRPAYIRITSGTLADFNFTAPNSCRPPTTIIFTNQSTGVGTLSYNWQFGDGGASTQASPSHTYNTSGNYTVTLIVKNSFGCTDTITKNNAIIIGTVTASFNAPAQICAGKVFTINNTSSPAPTGAAWTFGDNTSSSQLNPSKVYAVPGNYSIKLVGDFGACKDSIVKSITVLDKPLADFNTIDTNSCKAPFTVSFNAAITNSVSHQWFFGDGNTSSEANPKHTYSGFGAYDVILVTTNGMGCTDTVVKKKYIQITRPRVSITNLPWEGCVPYTFQPVINVLTNDVLTGYQWDFGDGNSSLLPQPSNKYDKPGTYTIKLVYTTDGGCTDSTVVPGAIRIGELPIPNFTALPPVTCAFLPVQFTNTSTGAVGDEWLWDFGDGTTSNLQNPSHFYSDTGRFTIKLVVSSNGCKSALTIRNMVYIQPPIARFFDSSSCDSRFTKWFRDRSIEAHSWFWDFGDGITSTLQNPVHTYAAKGNYIVSLTVKNGTCEHTTRRSLKVIYEKAGFSASDTVICKGSGVTFTANNINLQNIIAFNWSFGDGNHAGGNNVVTHIYRQSGKYDVRLIIADINGCADSLMKPAYIRADGPTANFSTAAPAVCTNTVILFTDASASDGTHPLVKWIWNYDDGKKDTLSAPPFQHSYTNAGNYNVKLNVIDSKGCIDSVTKFSAVLISKPAPVFLSPDSLSCANKPIRFLNQTTSNTPTSYLWRFGDGQTSTLLQPVHSYNTEGDYSIQLIATDRYGCIDSLTKTKYIRIMNPRAIFTVSDSVVSCPPLVVNFTNQSLNYISYEWHFGDNTQSALNNPLHFYTFPGTYRATLVITSRGGCIDSSFKLITVRGPEGKFTYDNKESCSPSVVNFKGTTKDKATFTWDFGDGDVVSTSDSNISHTYSRIGHYLPKMILVDPQGCRVPNPGPDTIKIFGASAKFLSSQRILCDSGIVNFTDSSQANDPVIQYRWDFGDGHSSSLQNPSHFYTQNGNYPVQLIVTTQRGCKDTADLPLPVRIVQSPLVAITGDTGKCTPAVLQFSGMLLRADTSALTWKWSFGNNTVSSIQHPLAVTYNNAGVYTVRMITTNSSGCADTADKIVQSYPIPVVNAGADVVLCVNNSVKLQASGALQYSWNPVTALSCIGCDNPTAAPLSNTTYYVTGNTQYHCAATDSIAIEVKQPFKIHVSPGDTLCMGESHQLQANGADLYAWTPSVGLSNNQVSNPVSRPTRSVTYQVIGRDDHNCFYDTAYVPVVVYPYPTIDLGADKTIQVGTSVQLNPVASNDIIYYKWRPANWLSCVTCPNPIASPKQTTVYTVDVLNQGGCASSDKITLFVFCDNANLFMPNTFSPNGDGSNDYFYPRGRGLFSVKSLRIFNRWGEVIFQRDSFNPNEELKGWDGTHKGKPASQDVYVYSIEVICENKSILTYGGNVALVR
jgi:gliding motility-associated-like protein